MDGFKQCRVSDGHLADVLILSAQELVQLAALHKSTQSTGYFWWKSTNVTPTPPPPNPPSAAKTTRALFFFFSGNQSGFLADLEVLAESGKKESSSATPLITEKLCR